MEKSFRPYPIFFHRIIINALHNFIKKTFLTNDHYYYGKCFGSDHWAILLIKNILAPKRMLKKILYGQIFPLPAYISKGKSIAFTEQDLSPEWQKVLNELKVEGVVALPFDYTAIADHLVEKYKITLDDKKPGLDYTNNYINDLDGETLRFVLDENILKVFGIYWGRQPYVRSAASLKDTYSDHDSLHTRKKSEEQGKFQTNWHFDTVNMLQVHLLLADLTENDTHMVMAKRQHRRHHRSLRSDDYFFSDEYIYENYEVIPFVGKKGTAFLFDSNATHKAIVKKGTRRLMLQNLYTPGNDILKEVFPERKEVLIKENKELFESLSPMARESLRYIM